MSSVVNKSKNKFAPKIKVRPRPGSSATPVPQEPSSSVTSVPVPTSVPLEKGSNVAPHSQSQRPAESESATSNAPQPRDPKLSTSQATQRELSILAIDNQTTSFRPSGGIPILKTSISTVPRLQVSQNEAVPALQLSNQEDAPAHRSSSSGIPTVQTFRPAIPQIRTSGGSVAIIPTPAPTPVRDSEKDGATGGQVENGEIAVRGSGENDIEMREQVEDGGRKAVGENADAKIKTSGKPAKKSRSRKAANGEGSSKRKTPASKSAQGAGKHRKISKTSNEEDAGEPTETDGTIENTAGGVISITAKPKKKRAPRKTTATGGRRGRPRAESPEDGESREISPSTTKMKDLCKDMKIGKKSKRFIELQQMDWEQVVQGQAVDIDGRMAAGDVGETTEQRLERLANQSSRRNMGAPQVRLVDGQIVIDEESLQIDRHERDALDEDAFEVVEENHNTRLVNSGTWGKREKVEKWDANATEKFYTALSMFGTDFELISRMFPARSRRQMKNKFNLEERKYPEKITAALRNRISVDIRVYSEMADTEFPDPQEFADELQQLREAHNAEEQEAMGHAAEMERERQEAVNAAMRENENEAVTAEQAKKKKKKGKGKAAVDHGEEEVMTIEEYEAQKLREAEAND